MCRFSWGAFFKNWVSVRTRPGADVSVCFGAPLNPLVLSCPPSFNCWCECKGVHLVTSADPCQGDDSTAPLIGRSSASSIGFYFSSSPIRRLPSVFMPWSRKKICICFGASLFVHSKFVSFPCYLLTDAKVTGIWTLNLLLWFLVTIRQPIHEPHPLIGRSSTSSTGFLIFHPIYFGCSRNLFNIPSDGGCAVVRERLLLPPITTWWV